MAVNAGDRFAGCLLGLAAGDAVGTTVEFRPRGSFQPVRDMVGGGPFRLAPGQWTDDTSMALCLAASLIETNGFDPADQMERYCDWQSNGYMSSTGVCFDIGNTVSAALRRFRETGNPFSGSTDRYSAGNGSIMRLAPIPMYYFQDFSQMLNWAGESSRTTHGAAECIDACRLFGSMLWKALAGKDREEILAVDKTIGDLSPAIMGIAVGEYIQKSDDEIRGSGYVVHSLEAALWCFYYTESYEAAVLKAVNLGEDADTTAAVCGQIAGAYYGKNAIPSSWLEKLSMRLEIETMANTMFRISCDRS